MLHVRLVIIGLFFSSEVRGSGSSWGGLACDGAGALPPYKAGWRSLGALVGLVS